MNNQLPVITTTHNGKTTEWITVIEEGIPVWVPLKASRKHMLAGRLSELLEEAAKNDNDEPVIFLKCEKQSFEICYFPEASLYLCEELDGRYSTVPSLTDALWQKMGDQEILSCTLLP